MPHQRIDYDGGAFSVIFSKVSNKSGAGWVGVVLVADWERVSHAD